MRLVFAAGLGLMLPVLALAQPTSQADSAARARALIRRSDVYVFAGFAGAAAAVSSADRHLASQARRPKLLANTNVRQGADAIEFFGGVGPYVVGAMLYAGGRGFGAPHVVDLAVHGTEAVIVGSALTGALKMAFGRARPYVSADTNPREFSFGRGLRGDSYQSLPSGHTTAAFAFATALTSETSTWWPRSTRRVALVAYGGATLVGLARMYHDMHWASDVVLGAGVGILAGVTTVRLNHARPGNRLDRWLLDADSGQRLQLRVSPTHAGFDVGLSVRR